MRPAQLTPENSHAFGDRNTSNPASMRPAQLTPENPDFVRRRVQDHPASMRPAQLTPENDGHLGASFRIRSSLQ